MSIALFLFPVREMVTAKKLILASRSPRRRHLLSQIGLQFELRESGVDEEVPDGAHPREYVTILSKRKAEAVGASERDAFVIGADTIVLLGEEIMNKPRDEEDAARMLARLSGRTHAVYTGFTILDRPSGYSLSDVEMTEVTFRTLGEAEILAYVRSGSPMDKAGAYGIQDDFGAVFVERINGCFYNVVGFPLARFYTAFQKFQSHIDNRGKNA